MGTSSRFVPGVVVNHLKVLDYPYRAYPDNPKNFNFKVRVECLLCGREVHVWLGDLYSKNTQSCGCLKKTEYANPEVRPHDAKTGRWKKLKKARK